MSQQLSSHNRIIMVVLGSVFVTWFMVKALDGFGVISPRSRAHSEAATNGIIRAAGSYYSHEMKSDEQEVRMVHQYVSDNPVIDPAYAGRRLRRPPTG
jgi:hypothetical protein